MGQTVSQKILKKLKTLAKKLKKIKALAVSIIPDYYENKVLLD